MKDREIRTAEKIIDSSFDLYDTMAFFYATYQDGEYILTQLSQAVDQEKMIRNAVGNLEEHADYFKYCTKWREKVDSWKTVTPPIPVTWYMFKSHFNKSRTQIDNNPTGKHAMKINEV